VNVPAESLAMKKARAVKVIRLLKKDYPDARCSLDFETVHQLMVATILSAQCTDERVNAVTPALFAKYRSVADFAAASEAALKKAVYSTGFHNNKARAIRQSARELLERHGGEVPGNLDDLVRLTGVGRKTASVILGAGFSRAEGVVVDTHVARISRKLGFTDEKDALKIERDLMRIIPRKDWIIYAHLLIDHGRAICRARKPDCPACSLNRYCPSASL
jgi:endonuclease-3